jgi:hypothetical protein
MQPEPMQTDLPNAQIQMHNAIKSDSNETSWDDSSHDINESDLGLQMNNLEQTFADPHKSGRNQNVLCTLHTKH